MNAERNELAPSATSDESALRVHPVALFDTHAHLDQPEFDADRSEVIARARAAGVETMLCPAVDADSSQAVLDLAEAFNLPAAVGIHPNSTTAAGPDDWQRVERLSGHARVAALGETGLDLYRDFSPLTRQQEYLDRHLRLAQSRDLPVILHCRDAAAELMPMLREAAARGPLRGVLHAFSGDAGLAAECLALGLFISFAGNVTYTNRKLDSLRAAARVVPDDRLLIETDSPCMVPQVFRGKPKRNEPANVVHTAAFLAELRGVSVDQIASLTTANARRCFRWPRQAGLPPSL